MSKAKTNWAATVGLLCAAGVQAPAMAAAAVQDAGMVVVSATLREHQLASAPAFTTVLTAEDIAKSPVNSLADLLRESVGVNNQSDGTGRDEIQIRGLAGKYTLMLVNGRRVSSSGALWRGGDFDFSTIPLNSIKRVEIVRGPMAALYGSDAIGGVINIITNTPTQAWSGSVSGEYRSIASGDQGQQHRLGAAIAGAFNDELSLSVAAEDYDRKPWYSTSAADTTRAPRLEQKQAQNLVSTLTWKLSETQSLDIDYGYNRDQRPLGLYYYSYNPKWDYTSRDFRAQSITRNTYGVTHKALWNWGSSTAYLSHEDARVDDFNSRYNKPQQRVLKESNTYAKFYGSSNIGDHGLTAGVDVRRQTIKDPLAYLRTGQSTTNTSAFFLEDEITLNKQLSLTLAGRADHTSFGQHFTPKTYLVYQATPEWTVKGGVNRAFKAPDAYQLVKDYSIISCGGNCYLNGNPDLTPEQSTNYEFGAEFHRKGLNASAAVFKNEVKDMIVSLYRDQPPSRNWANVAKASTSGVELQADAILNQVLTVSGNYTHLNAQYTDENGKDVKLDNRPRQMASLSLNWSALPWLQTSLAGHYTGEQFYQGGVLPAYTRIDWSASAKAMRNLTLRFGVKNLSNVELEHKNKNFATFELGRNYYVSAAYAF